VASSARRVIPSRDRRAVDAAVDAATPDEAEAAEEEEEEEEEEEAIDAGDALDGDNNNDDDGTDAGVDGAPQHGEPTAAGDQRAAADPAAAL